jgi:hypothetical protein
VPDGVVEEVAQHPVQGLGVRDHRDGAGEVCGHLDVVLGGQGRDGFGGAVHELAEVDREPVERQFAGVEPCEDEQVVHHAAEQVDVARHRAQVALSGRVRRRPRAPRWPPAGSPAGCADRGRWRSAGGAWPPRLGPAVPRGAPVARPSDPASSPAPTSSSRSIRVRTWRSPFATRWAASASCRRSLVSGPVTLTARITPSPAPSSSAARTSRSSAGASSIALVDAATTALATTTAAIATTRIVHRNDGRRRWTRVSPIRRSPRRPPIRRTPCTASFGPGARRHRGLGHHQDQHGERDDRSERATGSHGHGSNR